MAILIHRYSWLEFAWQFWNGIRADSTKPRQEKAVLIWRFFFTESEKCDIEESLGCIAQWFPIIHRRLLLKKSWGPFFDFLNKWENVLDVISSKCFRNIFLKLVIIYLYHSLAYGKSAWLNTTLCICLMFNTWILFDAISRL